VKALEYPGYGLNIAAILVASHVQSGRLATRFVWVVYGLTLVSIALVCLSKMGRR